MRLLVVLALAASGAGCDKLFSLQHVNRDADIDAAPCAPRSVATGRFHSCSVDYQGRVYCWGGNELGQAQPQGPKYVPAPTRVILPLPAVQVAAGKRFSCARLEDGAVWCWGDASLGQLGGGLTDMGPTPKAVPAIPASAEIHAGGATACSRSADDGTIWCWGGNKFRAAGQTIDAKCPGNESCVAPGAIDGTAGSKSFTLGHRHACLIDANDRIGCWGRDIESQLGDGGAAGDQATLPRDIPQLGALATVVAGNRHTCSIDQTGGTQCWGQGDDGQLGTGLLASSGAPTSTTIEGARAIALGHHGGCALLAGGTVTCWGAVDAGDGAAGIELTPVMTQLDGVVDIASHFEHTCAIAHGDIYCWGLDDAGQLGRGTRAVTLTPVTLGLANADLLTAGRNNACAHTPEGIFCWGDNDYGQLGADDLQWRYEPYQATTDPSIDGIATRFERTCMWAGGQAKCWGHANSYALGNQVQDRHFATPQPVSATGVAQVTIGGDFICVRHTSGNLTCFGYNGKGQLGTPFATVSQSKTGVTPAITNVDQVTTGRAHTCALAATVVSCWGWNEYGQLGDGTKVDKSAPTPLTTLPPIVELQAGYLATCARDMVGSIWCWGNNTAGQLGDGTVTQRSTPVKVMLPASRTATKLAVGGEHACAKLDDGSVACWGSNDVGQLGNGTSDNARVPVVIPELAGATLLALGETGTCALVNGAIKCTGDLRLLAAGDHSRSIPALTARDACAE